MIPAALSKYDAHHMWFRILFLDRYLCLMLGLPQGCYDRSMATEARLMNDTLLGRLERVHCLVASRILERNETQAGPSHQKLTRELDVELKNAAKSLPSKWWLTPRLEHNTTDSLSLFWETRQLFGQMMHYNLLNQLHLPYMLCQVHTYDYSRLACVNASREMLSRFLALASRQSSHKVCFTLHTVIQT